MSVQTSPVQAVLANARRAIDGLEFAGVPVQSLKTKLSGATLDDVESVLAPFVLLDASVSAAGFVTLSQPNPTPLVQGGWRTFLLKISNPHLVDHEFSFAGGGSITSSPAATGMVTRPYLPDRVEYEPLIRDDWWVEFRIEGPLELSGLPLEYWLIHVYSRDAGQKSATVALSFPDPALKIPRGNSDEQMQRWNVYLGGTKELKLEFVSAPAQNVILNVRDADGRSCVAAVTVRDAFARVYPSRALRLAPDMFFHDHVYRAAGEPIRLPDGDYKVTATRGPEYLPVIHDVTIRRDSPPIEIKLERWVDPASRGYYSGDPHIHGGGCSHYSLPTEGVTPETMIRHARGEGLWLSSVLTWGPCYYNQKQYFSGQSISPPAGLEHPDNQRAQGVDWAPQATDLDDESALCYDIEVSGFPSSHSGHVILLGLTDQDYPGTKVLEDWPSWNGPIHNWARAQGALTGYAHCGNGMNAATASAFELPNYEIPPFASNGSNEFLVDVALGIVDFIAGAEVPLAWEANVWYHLLNAGYRPLMIGETDYPCIFDDRPGVGRTYVKLSTPPTGPTAMREWIAGLRNGVSYFGDGRSHIFDFALDGSTDRDRRRATAGKTLFTATVAAMLPEERPLPRVPSFSYNDQPYGWNLEWARIDGTRHVPVELIVNGSVIGRQLIQADGGEHRVEFEAELEQSSWAALRIVPSVHTQPIFIEIADAPIRASRRSAEWLRDCVDALWEVKHGFIRELERTEARLAYDEARAAFVDRATESKDD